MNNRKEVDLYGRGGGKKLEGIEGGEAVVKIY